MDTEQTKQLIKNLYENEETAVKLLKENVELKNKTEDLEAEIENLKDDINYWKGKYNDLLDDLEENYKPIPVAEQVGISERDFY